jgi:hypothetical protein
MCNQFKNADRTALRAPRGTKSVENPNGVNRGIAFLALEALGAQNIPGVSYIRLTLRGLWKRVLERVYEGV